MEWITELDGIVEEYDCHPFAFTMLGRLPTELRQIVIDSLPRHDWVVTARVHSKLRDLVERNLYHDIEVPSIWRTGECSFSIVKLYIRHSLAVQTSLNK